MEHNNKGGWSLQPTRIHEIQWTSLSFLLQCSIKCHFYCRHCLGYTRKYPTFQLAGTVRFNYFTVLSVRFPNLFCYKVVFFQTVFWKESGRHFASSSLSVELILAYQSLTFIRFFYFFYFMLFFHSFSIVIGCLNQWNLNVRRLECRVHWGQQKTSHPGRG